MLSDKVVNQNALVFGFVFKSVCHLIQEYCSIFFNFIPSIVGVLLN